MFSRRIFLKVAAAGAVVLSTRAYAVGVRTISADLEITIDSVDTPIVAGERAHRHVCLSGSQLERYNVMKSLFGTASELHIEANLDHAGHVLLETALSDVGRAFIASGHDSMRYSLIVRAA